VILITSLIAELDSVTKRFGKVVALDNVSIKFCKGITAVIGPNGSGKTTTAKLLSGLITPSKGKVYVLNIDLDSDLNVVKTRLGVLIEGMGYPPNLTVYRYLRYIAKFKGVESEEDILNMINDLGLSSVAYREINKLSSGMVKRLFIGTALIGYPELIILDEPFTNLDPLGIYVVIDLLRKICVEYGSSLIIFSHYLPELELISDRIVVLVDGTVKYSGLKSEFIDMHPPSKYILKVSNPEYVVKRLSDLYPDFNVMRMGEYLIVEDISYQNIKRFIHDLIVEDELDIQSFYPLGGFLLEGYLNVSKEIHTN